LFPTRRLFYARNQKNKMQNFFFVRKNGRFEKIEFSELVYVKAMRGYMQMVTDSTVYFILNTIEEVQMRLPSELFCRTHRSYIVAINRIQSFTNSNLILVDPPDGKILHALSKQRELPVGRAFRKQLRDSVTIVPNRLNKYYKKIIAEAAFLAEYGAEDEE
jgi:DNA-binding LytR/AlgR family response regulator